MGFLSDSYAGDGVGASSEPIVSLGVAPLGRVNGRGSRGRGAVTLPPGMVGAPPVALEGTLVWGVMRAGTAPCAGQGVCPCVQRAPVWSGCAGWYVHGICLLLWGCGISVGHMRGGFVGGVGCAFRPQWVSLQMSLCGGFGPYMYGRASKVCVHTERSAYTMCM